MQQLALAVEGLESALDSPPRFQQPWRHIVRERLAEVCESLTAERTADGDSWLSARAGHLQRERNRLLVRLSVLGTMVAEASDLDAVRTNLLRLVPELHHHQQRMNDLVYDAVSMDVGGSE
jgi:uncharacterized NAD(P)/FAD-binding protein YdhS